MKAGTTLFRNRSNQPNKLGRKRTEASVFQVFIHLYMYIHLYVHINIYMYTYNDIHPYNVRRIREQLQRLQAIHASCIEPDPVPRHMKASEKQLPGTNKGTSMFVCLGSLDQIHTWRGDVRWLEASAKRVKGSLHPRSEFQHVARRL